MALSGKISGSYNANYDCELRWTATQSITNNTSTIKAQWYMIKTQNYDSYNNTGDSRVTLNIGGTTYSKYINFDFRDKAVGTTVLLATYSRTITHNSDGTKSVAISGTHTTGLDSLGTKTLSGTANLDTIPRASSVSASNMTMGTASTITVTKKNSGFTHRLYYTFGSKSNIEITSGATSSTSVSFNPPLSLASEIPNATSATITIKCVTYNGSSQVGSATKSVSLSVPSSVKPSVSSISLAEAESGLNGQFGAYIQGRSKINGTVNTATAYGSAIASYRVEINGAVYTTKTFTTGFLKNSGSQTIKVTVTDRRGRTSNAYTTTYNVLAYTEPKITSFSVVRYKDANTQADDGEFVKVLINGTVTGLSNKNTIGLSYKYRLASQTTYTEASVSVTNYSFTYTSGLLSGFNANSSYIFEATLTDYFTSAITTFTLPTAFATIDILADGTSVAFGKVAEEKDCLDIGFNKNYLGRTTYLGKRSDLQKQIYFTNTATETDAPNGVYKHNCYIYGGQKSSEVSIGIYDPQSQLRALAYMQNRKRLYTEADIFEWKGKAVDRIIESTNNDNGTSVRVWGDGYCEICGKVDVTPTANTPTRQAITFGKTFLKVPNIQVTAHSSVIGKEVLGVSFSNPLRTGCDILVTRTNDTGTTVYWCAKGFISV